MKFPSRTKPTSAAADAEAPAQTAPKTPGIQALDELAARLLELQQERDALTAEIVGREKSGERRGAEAPKNIKRHARAMALLGGATDPAQHQNVMPLEAVYELRAEIDAALAIGRQKSFRLAAELTADLVGPELVAWRELVRDQALAIARLRNLTLRGHELRLVITEKSRGQASLIGGGDVLSLGNDGPAYELIQIALREKLVTAREVEAA